jgi:hypothetical protein
MFFPMNIKVFELDRMVFRRCNSSGNGAINIYGAGTTIITSSHFYEFYAGNVGAAIYIDGSNELYVTNSTFENNKGFANPCFA